MQVDRASRIVPAVHHDNTRSQRHFRWIGLCYFATLILGTRPQLATQEEERHEKTTEMTLVGRRKGGYPETGPMSWKIRWNGAILGGKTRDFCYQNRLIYKLNPLGFYQTVYVGRNTIFLICWTDRNRSKRAVLRADNRNFDVFRNMMYLFDDFDGFQNAKYDEIDGW